MSDTPLIIGKTYRICDTSANGFIGVGVLLSIDPPEYPKGSYEFRLIDDQEGIERGVFNREQIKEKIMSDTPRTDKAVIAAPEYATPEYIHSEFSRQLERENNALRSALLEALYLCDVPEHYQDNEWQYKRQELKLLLESKR